MPTLTMNQYEFVRKELEEHEKTGTCVDIRVKTNDTRYLQMSATI